MMRSATETVQQGRQYWEQGAGGHFVVLNEEFMAGFTEMVIFRNSLDTDENPTRQVFGEEHGWLHPPPAGQAAGAKALKQETPVD